MGGWIKTETVNWKYDIRGQATGGLIMDNYCFGDNHNPAKTFFQLQQLWWEHSEGGAQGAGLFLQRQIFVVKVFIYKWSLSIPHPATVQNLKLYFCMFKWTLLCKVKLT